MNHQCSKFYKTERLPFSKESTLTDQKLLLKLTNNYVGLVIVILFCNDFA